MRLSWREQGHGQPLVFLHGIGGGAACWQPQLDEFGRAYRALAWDMPGYGESEPLEPPTFAGYAGALRQFLAERGAVRPVLVGHSIGGMIAQEFLAANPGVARAVALVATSPAFGRPDGAWQQAFLRARLAPLDAGQTLPELAPEIVRGLVGPAARAEGIEQATRCMAAVPAAAYRAALACLVTFDRRAALSAIDIPCLVLAGEADTNAPPAMMRSMAAKIPTARFEVLPGLGHLPNLEDPPAFNAALRRFLENLP